MCKTDSLITVFAFGRNVANNPTATSHSCFAVSLLAFIYLCLLVTQSASPPSVQYCTIEEEHGKWSDIETSRGVDA